jgi:histidinol-phosphatase
MTIEVSSRAMDPALWLPFLRELTDRADAISTQYFRADDLRIDRKADASPVTQADLEVEAAIRDRVRVSHPELGVVGEEHGEEPGAGETRLIIDPIDATANFARGIPVFATLLAIEHAGEVVAGLVSAPALHTRWHAARGHGAWCGDRRMRVSAIDSLPEAQIFHGSLAGSEAVRGVTDRIPPLLARTRRQRGFGDFYQHMLVADGCGEIAIDPVVMPWDVAPLLVILEEAGGKATTLAGKRNIAGGSLVTSNGRLHAEALAAFADA